MVWVKFLLTFMLPCVVIDFFLNNQQDALVIQIYSVIKFYMFRASSLPLIMSFLLYIRHW
jgi:predicted permease